MNLIELAQKVSDETVGPRPETFKGDLEPVALSLLEAINAAGNSIVRGLNNPDLMRLAEIDSVSSRGDLVATEQQFPKNFNRFEDRTIHDDEGRFYDGPLRLRDYIQVSKTDKFVAAYYNKEIHVTPWTKKIYFGYYHLGWGRGKRRGTSGIDEEVELTELSQDEDTFIVDERLLQITAKYYLLSSLGQDASLALSEVQELSKTLKQNYSYDSRPFADIPDRPIRYRYGM